MAGVPSGTGFPPRPGAGAAQPALPSWVVQQQLLATQRANAHFYAYNGDAHQLQRNDAQGIPQVYSVTYGAAPPLLINSEGLTAIHVACRGAACACEAASPSTWPNLVALLVASGQHASKPAPNPEGTTPLHELLAHAEPGAYRAVAAVITTLAMLGADVNARLQASGTSPLQALLARMASWDSSVERKREAIAAMHRWVEVLDLLHQYGARVDHCDSQGATLAHAAARMECPAAIEWLAAVGAPLHDESRSRATPLLVAGMAGNRKVVAALLAHSPPPGRLAAALHAAVSAGDADGVEALLLAPSDAATYTPAAAAAALAQSQLPAALRRELLTAAAQHGHERIVRLLVARGWLEGLTFSRSSLIGATGLLHAAASKSAQVGVARFLLDECGASVAARSRASGMTAMHHACKNGHNFCGPMLHLLWQHGASMAEPDLRGRTVADLLGLSDPAAAQLRHRGGPRVDGAPGDVGGLSAAGPGHPQPAGSIGTQPSPAFVAAAAAAAAAAAGAQQGGGEASISVRASRLLMAEATTLLRDRYLLWFCTEVLEIPQQVTRTAAALNLLSSETFVARARLQLSECTRAREGASDGAEAAEAQEAQREQEAVFDALARMPRDLIDGCIVPAAVLEMDGRLGTKLPALAPENSD